MGIADERYAGLKLTGLWDREVIKNSKILLCGVGALGNEIAKNLVLLGVGSLAIVDFDYIEPDNLIKTVLFKMEDVGKKKVDIAKKKLEEINPDVQITAIHGDLFWEVSLGIFDDADIVLCALDSLEGRWFVNWLCWETGTPWVDGGLDILDGRIRSFFPGKTGCLECGFDPRHYINIDKRLGCGQLAQKLSNSKLPSTPTSASITAGFQVQEAIKILHQNHETLGKAFHFHGDFSNLEYDLIKKEECRLGCDVHSHRIETLIGKTSEMSLFDIFQFAKSTLESNYIQYEPYARYVMKILCGSCGIEKEIIKPEKKVIKEELSGCLNCGEEMVGVPLDVFLEKDQWINKKLSELLFPPNSLYKFRTKDKKLIVKLVEPIDN